MVLADLYGMNGWVLALVAVTLCSGFAAIVRFAAERTLDADQRTRASAIAGPLTPALAALFSVLVAFTVVSEAGILRADQAMVNDEAAAASRLAWASTDPHVEGAPIRAALADYLTMVVRSVWKHRSEDAGSAPEDLQAVDRLQAATRAAAGAPGVPAPMASELLGTVGSVTSIRRSLQGEAQRRLPAAYTGLLAMAGLFLIANVTVLTLSAGRRSLVLVTGIVMIVAVSLALLVGITAPFAGPFPVDHRPIDHMIVDLRTGAFQPATATIPAG